MVLERLVPLAMCFVLPQRTIVSVEEHLRVYRVEKKIKIAIQDLLQRSSNTFVQQVKPLDTSSIVKLDLSLGISDQLLLQCL